MFVVYSLLAQKDAQFAYTGITKWFKDNPDRDECVTETFTVRRGHVKEDILKNSEAGVVLKEKNTSKKTSEKKTASTKKSIKKSK
jgi:hypothetical protein